MSRINQPNPKRGEIWFVQFSPQVGSELGSPHPALVVSRDDVGVLPLRIVVPITSWQQRFSIVPWMPEIKANSTNGLKNRSVADCFQTRSFDVERFMSRWGELDSATLAQVTQIVAEVIGVKFDE